MRKRNFSFLLLTLGFLFLLFNFNFAPLVYPSPDVAVYYSSGYNLLGSTTYVSGSLGDLQSDNGIYMTFRSYGSSSTTSTKAMFAYGEGTITTPRYRIWNGTSWGAEESASTTASTVQWVVLKSSPKRDEKILGTLASTGVIHVQVWNGASWSVVQVLGSGVGTTNDAYRGFDIAFEQTSGRAVVVFVPSTTAVDPQYVIWNGSSWTAPATIDIPTTGVVYWVKLASRPLSDQIALMTLDANADIAGIIWNGSAWGNAKTLTTTASTATRECFAVEYEQQSGYAMFVWGEVATDLYYWRWDGSAWIGTGKTLLDIPAQGGISNWISLKADPNSNRLMLGVQDYGADLNTRQWNGSTWDTATEHPEHDATVENVGSRNFDVEYETFLGHLGHAILLWGDGATASWKHWTPTTGASGWSAATVLTGSDDTAVTQLRRNSDGKIFAAILDDPTSATDDLVEYRWDGNAWSSRLIIEGTTSMTAQPMMEPFMVAPDTHPTPIEYAMEVEFTGSSNTDYWLQLAWTIDSAWTTDNVAVTLQLCNYVLGDYPTSGDGYISYTSSATSNTDETKNQTITTNPTHFRDSLGNWKIKVKGVKSTAAQFDFKADLVKFEVTVGDKAPPVWSNTGTNNTIAGQPTLFFVKWTDNVGLSGFIFGTNNTGTWSNDTWVPMSGTTDWSNVTKILNSTAGLVVHWRVWANDTSNNWNDTGILSVTTTQPPVASFTYSPSPPYTSETVTFNASSSYDPDGTIVSYFWTFGDGTNGTGMITTHAYADNGVYTITLTVTDNDGLTDTDTQSITVLNRPPVASFTESATSAPTGTAIYFNASASNDPDGYIASYFWDFGDGTNATGVTVDHSYADDGIYTVTLTVTDDDGATATATATKTVLNRSPVASFTESATVVYTGEVIAFNASGSYDPDGRIASYFWDFGDGMNATGVAVTHAYADNGSYVVTLTVTDDDGATSSTTATKTVLNRPPVASFTESATIVYTGEIIYFNASASYDPDGSIVSYFWDFGDGTNATGMIVDHSYTNAGTYKVTLTVTDDDGATASATATKTVLNQPPIANFTESATTVYTGEVINFNASSSYDRDGVIVSYFWTFGDGANATGVVVSHAYSDNGIYTVTLTVTDNDGATATATATKTVLNRPPVAIFTESAETVYIGESITFNASDSYDPDGTIVSYLWDFGDGTNATGIIVSHVYPVNGTFTVTLTVKDNDGTSNSTSATKTVLWNDPPVALFTESAEIVYTGEVIMFNASASYDPDGSIVGYFWDFGDGTNATGVVVTHAYFEDGVYMATLTVTDNVGATGSATATKTVLNRPPVASFTESAETVLTGEIVYFNASTSYDPDGKIVSYFWTFGDGTNGTGVTVSHAYIDNGTYTVTLTVTDDDGETSSTSATKTILNRPPVATFTESATTVYTGEVIYFNASASYDSDGVIVSYFWTFGDGTNATGITVSHAYAEEGIYTVTLTITDNDGATASAAATKTVLNRPPVALFTESTTTAYTSEVIYFNASSSYDQDGVIVSYFWTFGDGTNASGATVSHAYANDGVYTVTLTVTDNDGATGMSTATKTILNRPPVASFTESASAVLTGEVIHFNASASYDLDGLLISYFWDFGDGTNATGVTVSHSYADNGIYTVTLTVTDNDGATAIATAIKTILNRSPLASFTESAETVYTIENISFNASTSYDPDGTIVSYTWDFGDGNITTVTTSIITHAYADNGTYTVTLTVTDNDGATATSSATKTVLNRPPVASFIESATTVYTSEVIYFNASASYDPDGTIVGYWWDFGDGTNATGMFMDHSYAENGTYTVTLTVTDDDGATASKSVIKTVLNRPPIALFTESAETVVVGQVIHFDASQSYDPDGLIVTYYWDFGDGTNATGVKVEHAYADNGVYIVRLTVTDDDGATASASATKTVEITPPVAIFTESAETVYTGEVIAFNASASYDSDGYIVSYFWTFGDGTNGTGMIVTHAYADDGSYVVTLTVTDDDGAIGTATTVKTVLNRPPTASFTESATTVYTDEVIYFNASTSYDSDGSIFSYFWDFGDGTNATGIVVQHSYTEDGAYTVTLTVTDDDGAVSTATATKTVLNRPPVAVFTESASTVYTGETITFNASMSYDPDGTIISYFWDLGDGTNATGIIVEHAYTDDGRYVVTLTLTDDDGAVSTVMATKTVLNRSPTASFTESAETVYTSEVIVFNASGSHDPDGTIVTYFWDFGDGTNATGVIVEHAYADDGNYTVTLIVTDDDGATATATATKLILNRPPVASFTESGDVVYTGETITFNASDSYDPDGTIVEYYWDFGDGTSAAGVAVTHAYTDNGTYVVTLTVTDDDGAASSTTSTKTVLNRPPNVSFTYTPDFPIVGETVTFNASESYDIDGTITNYSWDFGDGNITTTTSPIIKHTYTSYGNYTVTLTVTDNDGTTATTSKIIRTKGYPIADFTYTPATPYKHQTVTFNASISDPQGGFIVSYFWNFGDGTQLNTTDPVIAHIYTTDGDYTVTLTVTDSEGLSGTTSKVVTVVEAPPVANFTYTPTFQAVNQTIAFDASGSYDPNGYVVSYVWNFGDGNVTSATDPVIYHKYVIAGNYTVKLTVSDNDGLTNTTTKLITISNPPQANFAYSPEYPYVGDVVTFNASSSTAGNKTIVSYVWEFGDGSTPVNETDPITTHVYKKAGYFTVKLTVTDSDGLTSTVTEPITVLKAPVAVFTYSPASPKTFDTVTFDASESYDPNGHVVSYVWDFGDGNITTVTTPTITHYYSAAGNYAVILIVSDNTGYTDSTANIVTILPRPPIADFIYTPDFPIIRETVVFNASKSYDLDGTIVNYTWDFGDGNITTTTSPIIIHTYTSYGNYTVTLTVTDSDDLSDNKTSTVRVRDYPTAEFTVSPEIANVNREATFNASLSTPNGGVIVSYFWDFGDGTRLNTTDPILTHIYTTIGNYTAILTVTDSEGLNNIASKIVQVAEKPTPSFTYSPSNPYVGDTITFNASESYDKDGYIVSYLWNFGDGSSILNTTNPITTHTYRVGGNYTVALTVVDNVGLNDTTFLLISVNKAPLAIFTYSPESPIVGDFVTFNASQSYDIRRPIANYTWDFGDGNVTTTTDPLIRHTYVAEGIYTVKLIVMDTGGYNDTCVKTITIRNYPVAEFATSPSYPIKGEETTFDASSSQPRGGSIINYVWDFGDGTKLNTTNPITSHTFTAVGEYNVTLTVIDSEGLADTISKTITVRDYPTANFTWSPESPVATETVTFDASSSKANSGTIAGYMWEFGDGTILTTLSPAVSHAYAALGNYSVRLSVINSEGLSSSITKCVIVLNAPPVAFFEYFPEAPIAGETTTFNASACYDPDGTIASYTWDFGDGNITIVHEPIIYHIYAMPGDLTVKLTVTDSAGLTNSTTKVLKIVTYPTAQFTWSPLTPESSKPATFNASASTPNSGTIVNYTWNFGDGNVTTVTDPIIIHVYNVFGNYTVTLTVTNSEGLSSSISQRVTVVASPPTAIFTWQPIAPLEGQTVTFDASSSKANGGVIVAYEWNFGDGSPIEVKLYQPKTTHKYSAYGQYNVTLKVTDSEGLTNATFRTIVVIAPPNADFTWSPESLRVYETVTFNASASTPNGGVIISYNWNFGDGNITTVTEPIVIHYYTTAGNYTVTLTITDSEGLYSSISKTISITSPLKPEARFGYSPTSPYVFETVTFNASASTPGVGAIVCYTWDFGDGNITTVSDPIITHAYTQAGNYTVILTVINSAELNSIAVKTITVLPISGPTSSFTYSPTYPRPNQTITFNSSSSMPGWNGTMHPPIQSYTWDFGDGNITTTSNTTITHQFVKEGNYTVTLTVTDINGLTATIRQIIQVRASPPYDINGDGKVDIRDVAIVALAYGSYPGDPNWNPQADITGPAGVPDGKVDIRDVALVASHYGEYVTSEMVKVVWTGYLYNTVLLIARALSLFASSLAFVHMFVMKVKQKIPRLNIGV